MDQPPPNTVDAYIARFPPSVQAILHAIRAAIRAAAPEAAEDIRYGMPAYHLHGPLVYFGAHKGHIGFYPTPSGMEQFEPELARYARSKGTVQFPLDQPIPYDLVTKIVHYRMQENQAKAARKSKKTP